MSFNVKSPKHEVDQYLVDTYGYGLSYFRNSLENIASFYEALKLKKRERKLKAEIQFLEEKKTWLVECIDKFLMDTKLWDDIKQNHFGGSTLTQNRKISFIKSKFRLNNFFNDIDEKHKPLKKRLNLLQHFHVKTSDKKKRIKPHTLVTLVWYLAFSNKKKVSNATKFNDISFLIAWFIHNEYSQIEKLVPSSYVSQSYIIKNDYTRYIQNPRGTRNVYKDLALTICAESFSPQDS